MTEQKLDLPEGTKAIVSMIVYRDILFVATDAGVYWLHDDSRTLVPVRFVPAEEDTP